jgi:uncharacterized membrane protein YkvA (DUF1232 family)
VKKALTSKGRWHEVAMTEWTMAATIAAWRRSLRSWAWTVRRDVRAVYLAARSPRTPWTARLVALIVVGYALSPIDLIPDFVPVLGYLDDLLLLPLGILLVIRLIPPDLLAECRAAADEAQTLPSSHVAAAVIVILWVVAVGMAAGWIHGMIGQNQTPPS